ncbi:MAG: methyltransferase domain-containing protein [Calditrichaeota bacterium]|nr:methyltransferase domain-containing protein [Calditrichota bacterium]
MNCCHQQCAGIREIFNEKTARKNLKQYLKKGAAKTTRMLLQAIEEANGTAESLLDIGGGVGAIQLELLQQGIQRVYSVDASPAYQAVARAEAERRGYCDRIIYLMGDFVELAPQVPEVDIVTLDRVICCYPDVEHLVGLSARRARRLYGLVFPRERWWVKLGVRGLNTVMWVLRRPFRTYVHSTQVVNNILHREGFVRRYHRTRGMWQVMLYVREHSREA